MRFHENAIFEKRPKIDRKSVRVRISMQPRDDFAIFPAFGGDLGSILLAPGRLGTFLGDVLAPGRIRRAPQASPGARLGRSRGAPGTLRDAPGTPPERPWCPEVDFWSILGAPGASRERFLVDFRVDFGGILGLFWRGNRKQFRADFCDWWTNHKDRLTVRLTRRLTRRTA